MVYTINVNSTSPEGAKSYSALMSQSFSAQLAQLLSGKEERNTARKEGEWAWLILTVMTE